MYHAIKSTLSKTMETLSPAAVCHECCETRDEQNKRENRKRYDF